MRNLILRDALRNHGFVNTEALVLCATAWVVAIWLFPHGIQLRAEGSTLAGNTLLVGSGLAFAFGLAIAARDWYYRGGWAGVIFLLVMLVFCVTLIGGLIWFIGSGAESGPLPPAAQSSSLDSGPWGSSGLPVGEGD